MPKLGLLPTKRLGSHIRQHSAPLARSPHCKHQPYTAASWSLSLPSMTFAMLQRAEEGETTFFQISVPTMPGAIRALPTTAAAQRPAHPMDPEDHVGRFKRSFRPE